MKLSVEWLNDFVELHVPLKTFADKMTLSGSKVEAIEDPTNEITEVVVGQILSIEAHPDADRLQVCQVAVGKEENLQIVTAAKNIAVGDKVPVALVGAKLAGGLNIKKGKLRGVLSEGMFCSYHELALEKTLFPEAAEDGIFILPKEFPLGSSVLKELLVADASIEFEITSNRPDCFHVEGLAREAAVTLGEAFKVYQPRVKAFESSSDFLSTKTLKVDNQVPEFCKTYLACAVKNVKIQSSPFWLQKRLLKSGLRPINNVVDITNYVMLELGQPMHAFDLRQIKNQTLVIRKATEGELFRSLEGKEYRLRAIDHVIADEEKVLALAGVMGGENSGITDDTTDIVFEVAFFEPAKVRTASTYCALRTESSARFERLVDRTQAHRVLARACELIENLGIGEVASDYIALETEAAEKHQIELSLDRINRFLGTSLSHEYMLNLFEQLEIKLLKQDGDKVLLEMPSFRPDLEGFADIAEEVARFYEYNNIEASLMKAAETTQGGRSLAQQKILELKEALAARAYFEAYSNTLSSPQIKAYLETYLPSDFENHKKAIVIRNAAIDSSILRVSMLPDLMRSLAVNANRQAKSARLFEVGKIYFDVGAETLAQEESMLALASFDSSYGKHKEGELFYEMKHGLISRMGALGLALEVEKETEQDLKTLSTLHLLHPYRRAVLKIKDQVVGVLGYIHPKVAEEFEAPQYSVYAEISLDKVLPLTNIQKRQKPLPKFPSVSRDLAVLVNSDIMVSELFQIIRKEAKALLEDVELFDIYRNEKLGLDKKSLAFKLIFRSEENTLTDTEVEPLLERVVKALEKKLSAQVRK